MSAYSIIGLMSGTSLDGLDVALCKFNNDLENKWQYEIKYAKTYPYNAQWQKALASLHNKDALTFVQTDVKYGALLADLVKMFCVEFNCDADIIASHGHTIFHNPAMGYSTQIGNGATLAALTNKVVVADFRSLDVALGGQGAPLVPIGDKLLFSEFDFCINLGGFANISFDLNNERVAYDICPVNIILNRIYAEINVFEKPHQNFDEGGKLASTGMLNRLLYDDLNELPYYNLSFPKSLGREWLETVFLPKLNNYDIPLVDKMNTVTHHIAFQISQALKMKPQKNVLITGGGAYNNHLISCIEKQLNNKQIIIPDLKTIEYKEALIFAFLGLLRYLERTNCLCSVTGSKRNSCSGTIYVGNK